MLPELRPKVAAADHDTDLHSHIRASLDGLADGKHRLVVDAVLIAPGKRLAAEFQ